jgi:hypothetical protein
MRFLVAVRDLDGLVQFGFLQCAGDPGSELAGLLFGCVEIEVAVNDDGQRPDGLDEQDDDHAFDQRAHVVPEIEWAEANLLLLLKEAESCRVKCHVS